MGASPLDNLSANQFNTVNQGATVFQSPFKQDRLWDRVRAPFRIGKLGSEGFLTDTALDAFQGVSGQTQTGQELMDELPYLTLDPDKIYGEAQINRLRNRNKREEVIQFESLTLGRPNNLLDSGLQFSSGLAGSLWGGTVGDPAGLALNVGIGYATEGVGAIPAVNAAGGRVLSMMPRFLGKTLGGAGRTGAFARQTALGVVENTVATPLYWGATTSQGVEYTSTDALLDIGVGSVLQGFGGWLFPAGKHVNEAVPYIKHHREKLDVDRVTLDSVDKVSPAVEAPSVVNETQLELDLNFNEELPSSVPEPEKVITLDKPLNIGSEELNRVTMADNVDDSLEAISDLVERAFEDTVDKVALEGHKLSPEEARLDTLKAMEAKTVFETLHSLKEDFPELSQVFNSFDNIVKSNTVQNALADVNRAFKGDDIVELKTTLESALKTVKKSSASTPRGKSAEVRVEKLETLEAELAELKSQLQAENITLKTNPEYKKLSQSVRQERSRIKKAKAKAEGDTDLTPIANYLQKNLDNINAHLGEQDTSFNVDAVVDGLDGLPVPAEVGRLLSPSTLKKALYGTDEVKKVNNIKRALIFGIRKRLDEFDKFLQTQEAVIKDTLHPELSDAAKLQTEKLDAAVEGYKDAESFVRGKADEIKQRYETLQKMELNEGQNKLMTENIDKAKTLMDRADEMDETLARQALCFLGV